MNLSSPTDVRLLLERLGVRPSKSLGQNFLVDRNILGVILRRAAIVPGDTVLEVGPGLGVLTEGLLSAGARVTAVEKDSRLFGYLSERFDGQGDLTLIHADALTVDFGGLLAAGDAKVVSNLPYVVGSRILVDLAQQPVPPVDIVVTVQREVAARLVAREGGRDYGLLTLWCALRYAARVVKTVSANCFLPRPEVASTLVGLSRCEPCELSDVDRARVYRLSRTAFQHRRKQLASSLPAHTDLPGVDARRVGEVLQEMGLDPRARPAELSPLNWVRFSRAILQGYKGDDS